MNILTIDTGKINDEIGRYYTLNKRDPYIICSEETERLIISQCSIIGTREAIKNFEDRGKIAYYCGNKVLRDNSLKLGEIEVR